MRKTLSLTTDPIPQLIWRIGLPASVGMFFNTLFNFVDTYCAGLLSTDALAALSLSFPLYFLLIAVGSGLSQGATALIANALGTGDEKSARVIFAQSLVFAIVAGGIFSALGLLAAPKVFQLLGAHDDYLKTALAFMNVILGGGIFFVLAMALNSGLGAQGETRVYRNFLIVGCVGNCLLNPVLMWGLAGTPPLGVAGIALSTVLVQFGGCIYLWKKARHTPAFQDLSFRCFAPDAAVLKKIAGQSVPAALNMTTIAMGVFVITWFVKQFGKEAVAATGIATRIEQMVLLPAIGISTAMLSLAGQNHGARLPARVREAWLTTIKYNIGMMLVGGVILLLLGRLFMRAFTSNPVVLADGANYLTVSAFTLAAYPILFATVFLMQGLKRPAYGLWMGLYRQILAPILVMQALVFVAGLGLWGVWLGFGLVTWSAAAFAIWWGWRVLKREKLEAARTPVPRSNLQDSLHAPLVHTTSEAVSGE